MNESTLCIIQRQWSIVKDLLQINGNFRMSSDIYAKAMGFEDELYQIKVTPQNSKSEESTQGLSGSKA